MTRTGLKCPTEVPNSKWGWGWQRWRPLWWHWWGLRSPNEVPNSSRGPTGNRYPNDPSWSKIVGSCTIWTPCARINSTVNLGPQNGYKAEVTPAGATQLPWLLLRSEKWSHVSWCTDLPSDLKKSSQMFHDALLDLFRSRRKGWKCVICHDALTSLEIWKMVIKVSWCTDLSWDMTNNVHMCHDALTSVEIWNMFPNLSCRMHWLLLRSEKWSHICHDALSSLEISRMFTPVSWYTDFSWHLKNALTCVMMHFLLKFHECSHICHDALTSLEIWKRFTHMSWCTDFSWDLKNDHTYVMMHWLLLRSEK